MSWLSVAINKITGKGNAGTGLPPLTVGTVAGALARPAGTWVTSTLQGIGAGAPAGTAATAAAQGIVDKATNQAATAVSAAKEGIAVASATNKVLQGPAPWIILGIIGAAFFLPRRRK